MILVLKFSNKKKREKKMKNFLFLTIVIFVSINLLESISIKENERIFSNKKQYHAQNPINSLAKKHGKSIVSSQCPDPTTSEYDSICGLYQCDHDGDGKCKDGYKCVSINKIQLLFQQVLYY